MYMGAAQEQAVSKLASQQQAQVKAAPPPVLSPPTKRRRFGIRPPRAWRGFDLVAQGGSSYAHTARSISAKPRRRDPSTGQMVEIDGLSGLGQNESPMGFNDPEFYTPVNAPPASSTVGVTTGSIVDMLKSGMEVVRTGVQSYFDFQVQKTAAEVAQKQLEAGAIPTAGVATQGNLGYRYPYYAPGTTTQIARAPVPTWVWAAGGAVVLLVLMKAR